MSKYIIQYYTKTSTISKDKELVSLLEKLNSIDEKDEKSLKEILTETLKNVIQKESGLYKHSKNQLLKHLIDKKKSNTEIIEYVKQLEEQFLKGELTHIEFVDNVFKKAKKDKAYISRTHFLMYLKKLQEQKLLELLKKDPVSFLKKIKENNLGKIINDFLNDWINGPVLNDRKKDSFLTIKREIFYKIYSHNIVSSIFSYVSFAKDVAFARGASFNLKDFELFLKDYILKQSFFKKNKNKEFFKLKQFLFKIINSEPITDKDIEEWTNLDKAIKKIQKRGVIFEKVDIKTFKKNFFNFFRKNILSKLRDSFFERVHYNKEKAKTIEEAVLVMPYYKKLREISSYFEELDKNSIENILYISFNEKHEMQFFNFNPDSIEEILKHIQTAKQFLEESDEEIRKALNDFEQVILSIKGKKEITKNEGLLAKESYETLKEKLFLYREEQSTSTDPLFETFTNIRNAYKKTFFKSTIQMYDIYSQSGIANIKIKLDNSLPNSKSPYLKFNPDSRVFEYYDEGDKEPKFSLPVSAVMNKERTAVKKNISLISIISRNKRLHSFNNKVVNSINVTNYEEVNRIIQKNIYSFKQKLYKEIANVKKNKNNNPKI